MCSDENPNGNAKLRTEVLPTWTGLLSSASLKITLAAFQERYLFGLAVFDVDMRKLHRLSERLNIPEAWLGRDVRCVLLLSRIGFKWQPCRLSPQEWTRSAPWWVLAGNQTGLDVAGNLSASSQPASRKQKSTRKP